MAKQDSRHRTHCHVDGVFTLVGFALADGHTVEPPKPNGRSAKCIDKDCTAVEIDGRRMSVAAALDAGFTIQPYGSQSQGATMTITTHDTIRSTNEARARPVACETLLRDFPNIGVANAQSFLRGLPVEVGAAATVAQPVAPKATDSLTAERRRQIELKAAGLAVAANAGKHGARAEANRAQHFLSLVDRMGVAAASQISGYHPEG